MKYVKASQILESIKKPFDKIDEVITGFIGKDHEEIESGHKAIEQNRKGIMKALRFYYAQFKKPFLALYNALHSFFLAAEEFLYQLNAFLVGIYNGFINFIAGMVEGIALLFEEGGFAKIVGGIKSLVKQIKSKGFLTFLIDSIKAIFRHFKEKYSNIENSYDLLKNLGEDIVNIVLNVVLAVEGGISLFKKLKEILNKVLNAIKKPGSVIDDIKDLFKKEDTPSAKERLLAKKRFEDFVKKWEGKPITSLGKSEIINNLIGYTEQANKIAELIRKSDMLFSILNDSDFEKLLVKYGVTPNEAKLFEAFAIDDITFYRASKSVDTFMSELVHEGTHALDFKNGFTGNTYQWEKRAYFHERAFQQAVGMDKDFDTIEELVKFIYENY